MRPHFRDGKGMRFLGTTAILAFAFLMASCAGVAPGVGILAPKTLAGYEMDATGFKGSYYYRFATDGTYRRDTVKPTGKMTRGESGKWVWNRTSANSAVLILDGTTVVNLNFTTRSHANATLPTTGDTMYPVDFTAPR